MSRQYKKFTPMKSVFDFRAGITPFMLTVVMLATGGCNKADTVFPRQGEEIGGSAKVLPCFLKGSNDAPSPPQFTIYNSCRVITGYLDAGVAHFADDSYQTNNQVRITLGYNVTPANASYGILTKPSSGTGWGAWYWIYPEAGPSGQPRNILKIRARNPASPPSDVFNANYTYSSLTGVWDISLNTAAYDVVVTTVLPNPCGTKG